MLSNVPAAATPCSVSGLHRRIEDDTRNSKATLIWWFSFPSEVYPLLLRSVSLTTRAGAAAIHFSPLPRNRSITTLLPHLGPVFFPSTLSNNDPPSINMAQILRVDDSDPRIEYSPPKAWSTMQDLDNNGTYHQASSEGSSFFLLFRGE